MPEQFDKARVDKARSLLTTALLRGCRFQIVGDSNDVHVWIPDPRAAVASRQLNAYLPEARMLVRASNMEAARQQWWNWCADFVKAYWKESP